MPLNTLTEQRSASADILFAYRGKVRWRLLVLAALTLLCAAALLLDMTTGPSAMTAAQVWAGLLDPASLSPAQHTIIWNVRLPYALMAVLVERPCLWPGPRCRPFLIILWPALLLWGCRLRRHLVPLWPSCSASVCPL